MGKNEKIIVGISIGDYNGIGSEVILKTFQDSRMLEFCTPVVFASVKLMSFFKKEYDMEINFHGIDKIEDVIHKKINVLNVWKEPIEVNFGKEEAKAGEFAITSLKASVEALKNDKIDVLVTAPINKSNVQSKSFSFPGHTDYLAKELGGNSLMFMISEELKIGLLTDHVAVKDVPGTITRELIEKKINTINKTLIEDFGIIKPKIAVLGINPHTGDNGVIGDEDDTVLRPTIENIRNNGKIVLGPYAADSFFGSGNYKSFDAVVASYHDQGLIPFKTLAFGQGVNYTAGLSKIRTSPDHGTAYEIAGKNQANESSFKEAVFAAIQIYKNREEYQLYAQNPLKVTAKKEYSKKNF
ncbi:4-hydroxythreonine-4-phosphate dehydrogenase PdxA [Aureisphaera sp. CAU 1614]|uniref:4-hydroxythreonine-4-phosphate dehydrogenase PdxA n=1 Tax=Halomarinibacterium sedimenti TaxID=2857106 RepID=A0A9X1FNU3_9FLAO|nr:4-hydroxythreonine-4-phosphate dehydrogenase PdxA [Halomarinibacterium sedimenti]MBW2937304.1 4-hydroxythreonine-4-phosphate dehydrogenase PdxA [Halomarinibacterium sedimenti]